MMCQSMVYVDVVTAPAQLGAIIKSRFSVLLDPNCLWIDRVAIT